jgi:cell volume regulation protein A
MFNIDLSIAANTDLLLVVLGGVILIGFLAEVVFYKYRLPENLALMLAGMLIGPIFHIVSPTQVDVLRSLAPFFGDAALVIIVLSGSINLNFSSLIGGGGGRGVVMAVMDTLLTMAFITPLFHYVFGWPLLVSALFGAMLGETTATIVIPVSQRLGLSESALTSMVIDSTFNSVTCIVAFYIIFDILMQSQGVTPVKPGIVFVARYLFELVSTGIFIGAAGGLIWVTVLERVGDIPHSYIVTVAVVIGIYAIVDILGGSAVLSVLVFGLVLGNHRLFLRLFGRDSKVNLGNVTNFEGEINFFVRTFFYVFVGTLVSLKPYSAIIGLGLAFLLLLPRVVGVEATTLGDQELRDNLGLLISLYPRGLTVAVLASTLIASISPSSVIYPYASKIFDISFMVILFSSMISAFFVSREYRRRTNEDLYEVIKRLRRARQQLEKP